MGKWDKYVVTDPTILSKWDKYSDKNEEQPINQSVPAVTTRVPFIQNKEGTPEKINPTWNNFETTFQRPYRTLSEQLNLPTPFPQIASLLDVPMGVPSMIAKGADEFKQGVTVGNIPRQVYGLGQAGLGIASIFAPKFPMNITTLTKLGVPLNALSQVSPMIGSAVDAVFNPVSTIANPQSGTGKAVAGMVDMGFQLGGAKAWKTVKEGTPKMNEVAKKFVAKAGRFTGTPDQILKKSQIALREKINPNNYKSLDKLNNIIDNADNAVQKLANDTDIIATDAIMKYIPEFKDKIARRELTPEKSLEEITVKVDEIYKQRGQQIPADLALSLKKGIYEKDKSAYDQKMKTGKNPDIEIQTEMKIARGINEELQNIYPEMKKYLQSESDAIFIQKDIRNNVRRELNKTQIPHSLLLAFSPKWWLVKMISGNKRLEYGIGRLLYREGANKPVAKP
jgi:hypothetical protein